MYCSYQLAPNTERTGRHRGHLCNTGRAASYAGMCHIGYTSRYSSTQGGKICKDNDGQSSRVTAHSRSEICNAPRRRFCPIPPRYVQHSAASLWRLYLLGCGSHPERGREREEQHALRLCLVDNAGALHRPESMREEAFLCRGTRTRPNTLTTSLRGH